MIGPIDIDQLNFSRSGTANHFVFWSLAIWPSQGGELRRRMSLADCIDLTCDSEVCADPLVFPRGSVRLTYNRFAPMDRSQYLTFDEILGPLSTVTKVILSGYCIDEEWVFGKLRSVRKVMAITHWDRTHETPGRSVHPHWENVEILRPSFPKFPDYGVMHSKLILVFRPDSLRVVVSTANLVEYDYCEVQNAVYVHDLALSKEDGPVAENQFRTELTRVLKTFKLGKKDHEIERFDWSPVNALLLASEPGYFFASNKPALGIMALKELSSKWSIQADDACIEYQSSSIGKFTNKWLSDVFLCSTGKASLSPADKFRIVFPSLGLVMKSPLGPDAFGTIFSKEKDWQAMGYFRRCFYQCEANIFSGRPLHTKIMIVSENAIPKFYYLGSSNFTQSAWGKLVKDDRQLMICNYELGVLLDAKEHPITAPYVRPPKCYEASDCPWAQN